MATKGGHFSTYDPEPILPVIKFKLFDEPLLPCPVEN